MQRIALNEYCLQNEENYFSETLLCNQRNSENNQILPFCQMRNIIQYNPCVIVD